MPGFLSDQQILVLKQAHKTIRDKKLADRIKAVLSLNAGHEYSQVASILLLDEITLRRYVQKFQKDGLDGLLEVHYTGGQTTLTLAQELELREYLQTNTKRTAKEVVDYVFRTYEVKFSVIGITKLLHRLEFTYKKPKIIPGKADRVRQQQFLSVYEGIKTNLGSRDQVYFVDSTHPEHNTKPSYGWILRGKANDKFIKTMSSKTDPNAKMFGYDC